ncbi:G-protein coupled receptor dmsr-1-like [Ylistrum balloti]|uniref:G-protein coupled receptor dmsr-1-like n=1 Tax=Ylistrum balloti TaxID=509963 RepID=UPI002905E6D8|nr:G-protein coupled receptor dmsr-1-like [Ylistrum balloti]
MNYSENVTMIGSTDVISTEIWNITNSSVGVTTDVYSKSSCPNMNASDSSDKSALEAFSVHYAGVHGYVSVFVCLFGMLANTANIVVLTRKKMITSTNYILTWLAVADLFTMLDYFPFAIHFYILKDPKLPFPMTKGYGWVCFLMFHASFSVVCHTIAIWLTIGLAIFRFIFIWFPTKGALYCSQQKAKRAVIGVILYTIIICIPNYMSNEITTYCLGEEEPVYSLEVRKDGAFVVINSVNYWTQALLFKLVPCIMLTLLTLLLITAMHRAYKRRVALKNQGKKEDTDKHNEHNRTTLMLLAVVVLFLITELPQGILTILSSSIKGFFDSVYMPLGDLLDIVALCNNAINFVLYCGMSTQFRKTFFEIFCSCIPERRPGWRKLGVVTAEKNGCTPTTTTTSLSTTTTKL